MRTATWPEAKRAVQKVLLVDRLQQHDDGALGDLVFKAGYAKRTLAAIGLRYVVPTNRRSLITTRFEPVDQAEKVALQVGRILFRTLTIDSYRAVFARALVGSTRNRDSDSGR